jgi:CubicO group peptidase (beta-lactamase class C family)
MDQAELKKIIDHVVAEKSFSGAISIYSQNVQIYEKAFGFADRSNKLENDLSTRFGIASGTKFLTALAIGKLIDAKKLSLSMKLKDCIAHQFSNYSPEITIRHLLNHTSGIPDYYDEEKIANSETFALSVPSYALKTLRDYLPAFPDEPMKFEPGTNFSYCNGGFIILGLMIEEITGMKYQDYIEQEILKPIGMEQSGFFWLDKIPEKTALGYIDDATGWRTNIYNLPIVGGSDGGVFTTVQDINKLWKAFFSCQIVSKELVDLYTQPSVKVESEGENIYYGYGLWIRQSEDQKREVYILGGDAGVSFRSCVNQMENLQSTIVSNTTSGAWKILKEIDGALRSLSLRQA